jgi:metallophosphoesterase (TIGR00282 family)
MKLIFIGDVVGRPGRELLRKGLRPLIDHHGADFVIANVENANHVWDKKEAIDYIASEPRMLRPANFPAGVPGRGGYLAQTGDGRAVGVVNVMGRVFMTPMDDPFQVVLREIDALRVRTRVIVVDFHAEATSEKVAMGWHLDGRATLVVGTHTHVQTADERILPKGTAYLTDAGMTGPHDSIIGMEIEPSLGRFLNAMPSRFEPASANPRLNGIVVEADEKTGRALAVTRISYSDKELTELAAHEQPVRSAL